MSSMQAQSQSAALSGRVVLITGAAGGLGAAAAQACAAAGATVVLLGRKVRPLERIYDAVAALGDEPL
ncbi:short-chain dehydrogenase, partial [Pseudoxanthomonas kalamensis DSM 18571]